MNDHAAVERVTQPHLPVPSHIGQATAIEQSRAAAEVHAAVVVAQQCPRNLVAAQAAMRDSCKQIRLADRAFYRFSRGGQQVTGPTVHFARELARCWGNLQYGLAELRRDDAAGFSEMQAFAWDLQANTRSAQIFVVPHKRDRTGGPVLLTDMRDIYENNANQGSRRVRVSILSILPPWFVEEAEELCRQTLKHGGGKPLPQLIADAVAKFAELGIITEQLETKLGRPSTKWVEEDVATLRVIFTSIQRGEVTRDEEFPPAKVTAAEIQAAEPIKPARSSRKAATKPADEQPAADDYESAVAAMHAAGERFGHDHPATEGLFLAWPGGAGVPVTEAGAPLIREFTGALLTGTVGQ